MGVDHGGGAGRTSPPRICSGGIVPPDFVMLKNFTHQIRPTCITMYRKMCFLPLQQDFYSKSLHASPRIPVRSTPMKGAHRGEL